MTSGHKRPARPGGSNHSRADGTHRHASGDDAGDGPDDVCWDLCGDVSGVAGCDVNCDVRSDVNGYLNGAVVGEVLCDVVGDFNGDFDRDVDDRRAPRCMRGTKRPRAWSARGANAPDAPQRRIAPCPFGSESLRRP
ncbi:MAG: hypothetical protein HMLKMBBP_02160 [Planctomycetes bacterium]|nr:hypothetical protein [Planctomycetota bacterium]